MLGLDRGGSCRGVAYRVAGENRDSVLAYLRERELVTEVYREVWRTIRFSDGARPPVKALTYLADRDHVQYAGRLPRETLLADRPRRRRAVGRQPRLCHQHGGASGGARACTIRCSPGSRPNCRKPAD